MEGKVSPNVYQSDHFRIVYGVGSFAESRVDHIAARLESLWNAVVKVLELDAVESITVTLVEELTGPAGPGRTATGMVMPQVRQIREVYRRDSPGIDLEALVLRLIVRGIIGHPPVPFLLDGLLSCLMRHMPDTIPTDSRPALDEAQRDGRLPPLVAMFPGPKPATAGIYPAAAYGFVDFLLRHYGAARFRQFLALLTPGHGPEAAQTAFGRSLKALEEEWHRQLGGRPRGGAIHFLSLLRPYLIPYRWKVAEIVLYILISVAFTITFARVQGFLLDRALIPHDSRVLAITMAALAGAFVIAILAQLRASYAIATLTGSVMRDLRLRMFTLVQRLDIGYFHRIETGDILTRMTDDLDQVQPGIPAVLAQGLRLSLTVIAALITIFTLNWRLACLSLFTVPMLILNARVFGPRAAAASLQRQRNLARSVSTLQEDLAAQPVVKAFGLEDWAIGRYTQNVRDLFQSGVRTVFITGLSGATLLSIGSLTQLGVLGLGGYLVVNGRLSAGTLFAFLALMAQVIGPMQNLSSVIQIIQQASASMKRVQQLLQAEPKILDAANARPLDRLRTDIRLEDVSFSYSGEERNLKHISLTIPAGKMVALVGPSGCGKSTLLSMITRLYDPNEGAVRFDGTDLRTTTLRSLRGQIGIVPQESFLFNISIRENIRLGKLDATDEEVEGAARAAEIHDAILSLPDGYDTMAGERGGELSGGQRQRVAIARALIRDPSILILDEATSALDARTEAAVSATLRRIGEARTTIQVTHRLAAITGADRIVVMDRGSIVEQGSHKELLQMDGVYAGLWHEQMVPGAPGALSRDAVTTRLRRIPIFARLPMPLLGMLADQLHVERYRAGSAIVEQGAAGDELYIIRKGEVEVVSTGPAGEQRRLAVLAEGEHFGEIALLHGTPRMATVRARTPVEVYTLDKDGFAALLAAEPEMSATLERIIAERERKLTEEAAVPPEASTAT